MQQLKPAPLATDRELHMVVLMGVLADSADPVDKVDVRQDENRIEVRVWLRERIPGATESIPGTVRYHTEVISLDNPVGQAEVVDMAVDPLRVIPRA